MSLDIVIKLVVHGVGEKSGGGLLASAKAESYRVTVIGGYALVAEQCIEPGLHILHSGGRPEGQDQQIRSAGIAGRMDLVPPSLP